MWAKQGPARHCQVGQTSPSQFKGTERAGIGYEHMGYLLSSSIVFMKFVMHGFILFFFGMQMVPFLTWIFFYLLEKSQINTVSSLPVSLHVKLVLSVTLGKKKDSKKLEQGIPET